MFTEKLQNLVLIVSVQHDVRQHSTTLLCQLRQTVKSLETKRGYDSIHSANNTCLVQKSMSSCLVQFLPPS